MIRCRSTLFLGTDPLRPHEGKLQPDRLELKYFEIEVLTRGSFLWLRNIGGVFNQNADTVSISSQQHDREKNELYDFRIPGSALDLREVVQR